MKTRMMMMAAIAALSLAACGGKGKKDDTMGGGGSAAPASGKLYDRLNLTVLRSIPLGDRWNGSVKIAGNAITIATAQRAPKTNDRKPGVQTIEAARP